MNSALVITDHTKEHPIYLIFCPGCAYEYKSFEDSHPCPMRNGKVFDIDGMVVEK